MNSVLFISPVIPNQKGDGREKRAYHWVSHLAVNHHVHALVIARSSDVQRGLSSADDLPVRTLRIIRIDHDRSGFSRTLRRWAKILGWSIWSKYPLFWISLLPEHNALIDTWYQEIRPSRIICFRLYLNDFAKYAHLALGAETVELDMDDLESETWSKIARLMYENGDFFAALKYWLSARQFKHIEDDHVNGYSSVYVCSREDKIKLAARFPATKIEVFPNKIRFDDEADEMVREKYLILFVGTLDYYPNRDAILFFTTQVLPLLTRLNEPWRFSIIGYGNQRALHQQIAGRVGVVWTGAVDELDSHYRNAGIVVAPLRAGGGTKIKVMEAMLHGCPVVATSEAVTGLGLLEDVHYLHAETASEFAAQCARLTKDQEFAQWLGQSGRRFAMEHYRL